MQASKGKNPHNFAGAMHLTISMQEIGQRLISRKLKFQQFLSCFLFKKWHDYSDILEQIKAIGIIILHIYVYFFFNMQVYSCYQPSLEGWYTIY